MNLRSFFRNYVNARTFCSSPIDRIKYLVWVYGGSSHAGGAKPLTLKVRLASLGKAILEVRCNRGSDAFIFSEVFEHRYYDFDLPTKPATILDLGANIGLTALFFARKYPEAQLACVEPIPGNLALLSANLERNGVSGTVFAKAVTVDDQPVIMQLAPNDYGHKVSSIDDGQSFGDGTLRVEGISVKTILSKIGWMRIGLLKVDIEGYEAVLLRDHCEWLKQVDAMCIECHDGYGEQELSTLAKRFGFSPPQRLEGTILMVRDPAETARISG